MNILKIISAVPFLLLALVHLCYAKANIGVNFYDEVDFLDAKSRFTAQDIAVLPGIAAQKFDLLRTITDFNEGDPTQKICSCYSINGRFVNPRQCSFEKAFESTPNLKTVLTIENPKKWLDSRDAAIAYIYQFVIPLVGTVNYPSNQRLKPRFWSENLESMRAAGCVLNLETKNRIIAIVVGLEVGAHLNSNAANFDHKVTQVNNLDTYINNLIEALKSFGIKQHIYVTTSLAPSNCDLSKDVCGSNIYEAIKLKNNKYSLNDQKQQVDIGGKAEILDFTQIPKALKRISEQEYQGIAPGVLMSLYNYWMYNPNINYAQLSTEEWIVELQGFYNKLHRAFEIDSLRELPVSVGEIGWPSFGNNSCDHSPNQPSDQAQLRLLQAISKWGQVSDNIPYIFIWRLFDVGEEISNLYPCGTQNPEGHYGLYPKSLDKYVGVEEPKPKGSGAMPDFKS